MPLEFAFRTEELRSMCENEEVAVGEFGMSVADSLRQKLADLRAVESIAGLPPTTFLSPSDDLAHFILEVTPQLQIRIYPNHSNIPMKDGQTDWSRVHRVLLERA